MNPKDIEKIESVNMTSESWCKCYNFWNINGQYDLYIVFHEIESKENIESIMLEADSTIHLIMKLDLSIEKRINMIKEIISVMSDYGYAVVFVNYHDRKEGR